MPTANWIRIVIGLTAGAMIAVSALTGGSIDEDGLRWLGGAAGAITLLLLTYDRWIWRWPLIRRLSEITGQRVIHGTWRGTLRYQADGEGNPGQHTIFMAVHQTYSTVCVECFFPEKGSKSVSLAAAIEKGTHQYTVRYIYRQQAPAPDRDRNRPTEGACDLALVGRPVEEISGSYYAERGGRGTMTFDGHSPKVAGSAGQAERFTYTSLPGSGTR